MNLWFCLFVLQNSVIGVRDKYDTNNSKFGQQNQQKLLIQNDSNKTSTTSDYLVSGIKKAYQFLATGNSNDQQESNLEAKDYHVGTNRNYDDKKLVLKKTSERSTENEHIERMNCLDLKNYKNSQFIGEIKVGPSLSNYQKFDVIFDTGSSYVLLNSKLCKMPICSMHHKYHSELSSSFKKINDKIDIAFGSGFIKGRLAQDHFWINKEKIPDMKFGEIAESKDSLFDDAAFDGIIGLAFKGQTSGEITPFWDQLSDNNPKSGVILFSIDREENSQKSKICFGNLPQSFQFLQNMIQHTSDTQNLTQVKQNYIKDNISWFPVISDAYWQISIDNLKIGGLDVLLCENGCKAIIDTGSSLISGPIAGIQKLSNMIGINEECKNWSQQPDLTFVIGGIEFTLTNEDYVMGKDKDHKPSLYIGKDGILCVPAFNEIELPSPHGPSWILGDIFLSKVYTILDRDNKRVGLVKKELIESPFTETSF